MILVEDKDYSLRKIAKNVFGEHCQILEYKILLCRKDYYIVKMDLLSPDYKVIVKLAGPHAVLPSPFESDLARLELWGIANDFSSII